MDHNEEVKTYQVTTVHLPEIGMWEIHIDGIGVTQAEHEDDIEFMAWDYLDCFGLKEDGATLRIIPGRP